MSTKKNYTFNNCTVTINETNTKKVESEQYSTGLDKQTISTLKLLEILLSAGMFIWVMQKRRLAEEAAKKSTSDKQKSTPKPASKKTPSRKPSLSAKKKPVSTRAKKGKGVFKNGPRK